MCLNANIIEDKSKLEFIKYPFNKKSTKLYYGLPRHNTWGPAVCSYGIGLKSFRQVQGKLYSRLFLTIKIPQNEWLNAQRFNPEGSTIAFQNTSPWSPVTKAYYAGWHIYTSIVALSKHYLINHHNLTPVVFSLPYLQEQEDSVARQLVASYLFVPKQNSRQDNQIKAFLNRKILKYEKQHPLADGCRYELFNVR